MRRRLDGRSEAGVACPNCDCDVRRDRKAVSGGRVFYADRSRAVEVGRRREVSRPFSHALRLVNVPLIVIDAELFAPETNVIPIVDPSLRLP